MHNNCRQTNAINMIFFFFFDKSCRKTTVQVFNPFSSTFPQIITNLTEVAGELVFTERLERLYLIMIIYPASVTYLE